MWCYSQGRERFESKSWACWAVVSSAEWISRYYLQSGGKRKRWNGPSWDEYWDYSDVPPKRVPTRRIPHTLHQVVANQLRVMQQVGVIEPSISQWVSPIVLVKKKDGTHRLYVDYRSSNKLTKLDRTLCHELMIIPISWVEHGLFTSLDLANGFWQIRVAKKLMEQTAFTVPQGLFQFKLMPFGLTNAAAVFQWLMQKVFVGLNPEGGRSFVSV